MSHNASLSIMFAIRDKETFLVYWQLSYIRARGNFWRIIRRLCVKMTLFPDERNGQNERTIPYQQPTADIVIQYCYAGNRYFETTSNWHRWSNILYATSLACYCSNCGLLTSRASLNRLSQAWAGKEGKNQWKIWWCNQWRV